MKYKVGDKVKIKTWKQLKKKYEFRRSISYLLGYIDLPGHDFPMGMEEDLKNSNCDRNLIIERISDDGSYYEMEGISWGWSDEMIKCLVKDRIKLDPVKNRWEILDL